MVTIEYTDLDGEPVRFTGDDIEHCHEQMLDFLAIRWNQV